MDQVRIRFVDYRHVEFISDACIWIENADLQRLNRWKCLGKFLSPLFGAINAQIKAFNRTFALFAIENATVDIKLLLRVKWAIAVIAIPAASIAFDASSFAIRVC